jgi:hypothetical protein
VRRKNRISICSALNSVFVLSDIALFSPARIHIKSKQTYQGLGSEVCATSKVERPWRLPNAPDIVDAFAEITDEFRDIAVRYAD